MFKQVVENLHKLGVFHIYIPLFPFEVCLASKKCNPGPIWNPEVIGLKSTQSRDLRDQEFFNTGSRDRNFSKITKLKLIVNMKSPSQSKFFFQIKGKSDMEKFKSKS